MSNFLIEHCIISDRKTVKEKRSELKTEEITLQIKLISSGDTTKISTEYICNEILKKLKVI